MVNTSYFHNVRRSDGLSLHGLPFANEGFSDKRPYLLAGYHEVAKDSTIPKSTPHSANGLVLTSSCVSLS